MCVTELTPEQLRRIAEAVAIYGWNGMSYAGKDSNRLASIYDSVLEEDTSLSFQKAKVISFERFVAEVVSQKEAVAQ